MSLTVHPGESITIMGRVGAGKTTLLKLLIRLLDPPAHSVFVDGHDVRDYPLSQLRSQIAFVPQDPFLFGEPLRDNLTYDDPVRALDLIWEAAASADFKDTVEGFADQLETIVGERGVTLSGGQKQRATLARGLIRQAPVLVLDDCFSSVDTETEEHILSELKRLRRGQTTLLIRTAYPPRVTPIASSCSKTGASSKKARISNCWRAAACTRNSNASSAKAPMHPITAPRRSTREQGPQMSEVVLGSARPEPPRRDHAMFDAELSGQALNLALLRRLLQWIRPYRATVALSSVLILVSSALQVMLPVVISVVVVDHVIMGSTQNVTPDMGMIDVTEWIQRTLGLSPLAAACALFAVLQLGWAITGHYHRLTLIRSVINGLRDLRIDLFRHLETRPSSFYDRVAVGRIMTRVTNDIEALYELLRGIGTLIGEFVPFFVALVIMLAVDVKLTVIMLLVMPIMGGVTYTFQRITRQLFRLVRQSVSALNQNLQENLAGLQVVQLSQRQEYNEERYGAINARNRDVEMRSMRIETLYGAFTDSVSSIALALVVWYGAGAALQEHVSLGGVILFTRFIDMLFHPIVGARRTDQHPVSRDGERRTHFPGARLGREDPRTGNTHTAAGAAARRSGVPSRRLRLRLEHPGAARRDVPHRTRRKAGDRRSDRVRKEHHDPVVGALLRLRTRADVPRRHRPEWRFIVAKWPAPDRHRVAGLPRLLRQRRRQRRLGDPGISRAQVETAARLVHAHDFICACRTATTTADRTRSESVARTAAVARVRARPCGRSGNPGVDEATASIDTETELLIQDALRRLDEGPHVDCDCAPVADDPGSRSRAGTAAR